MSKKVIELSIDDQVNLIGKLEGILESLQQSRCIKKETTRALAMDNIEFRLEDYIYNLKYMLDHAETIRFEK